MSSALRFASLSSLLIICACQPPASDPPGPGVGGGSGGGSASGGGNGGGGGAVTAPGIACLQILECLFTCATSDSACQDACYNRGSAEGQTTLLTFAQCVDAQQCNDAPCIQAQCAVSLAACVNSSRPPSGGTPLQGSGPAGDVPADLAGVWVGARNGITQRLTLDANGTGSWETSLVTQAYACLASVTTVKTGTVVVAPKTITLYASSVVQQEQECSPPAIDTNLPAVTEVLPWERVTNDPNTILLIDGVCAAQYPGWETCDILGCPVPLYCTGRLTRQ